MKTFKMAFVVAASLTTFAVNTFADVVVSAGSSSTSLLGATILTDGGEFFDNPSADAVAPGPDTCNIGHILVGTFNSAVCANQNGSIAGLPVGSGLYSYLNNGGAATPFSLTSGPDSVGYDTTLYIEIAANREINGFGVRVNGVDQPLTFGFSTANPVSAFISIPPAATVEFYATVDSIPNTTYYSGSSNRFALFTLNSASSGSGDGMSTNEFVVGFEDGIGGRTGLGDADYQDAILRIKVVPEPATVVSLSLAVLGTLAAVRRRRKA